MSLKKNNNSNPATKNVIQKQAISSKSCSYGDVTIEGEGLQNIAYIRHLRHLSSKGSLSWYTCCDTRAGVSVSAVSSEGPLHLVKLNDK